MNDNNSGCGCIASIFILILLSKFIWFVIIHLPDIFNFLVEIHPSIPYFVGIVLVYGLLFLYAHIRDSFDKKE